MRDPSKWGRIYRLYCDDKNLCDITLQRRIRPMATRTQGLVTYSGKAVHRLEQNEGLSPPVMFRSNPVMLSTRRRMSLPP